METSTNQLNRLSTSSSPYLKQHESNPVNWYPWGEEAFRTAQIENKPIFLSIGYATCHWCHVMEADSFSRADVARVLNKHFIAIKVDREERPDVDSIYMNAIHLQGDHGGWPLSGFLTPEAKPIWLTTFIPRTQFIHILKQFSALWHSEEKKEILNNAEKLQTYLRPKRIDTKAQNTSIDEVKKTMIAQITGQKTKEFDTEFGGFGTAPKFPPSITLSFFAQVYGINAEESIKQMAMLTLKNMIRGGIFDHLGGGLHRYSTDDEWRVPHFEKMLYDNALLLKCLSEWYLICPDKDLYYGISKIFAYLIRRLKSPTNLFYSAEDADTEHCEGRFYLWTTEEIRANLSPEDSARVEAYFNLRPEGNFEISKQASQLEKSAGLKELKNANVFYIYPHQELVFENKGEISAQILDRLYSVRETRSKPLVDVKTIVSWNALLITGLTRAFLATQDRLFLNEAQNLSESLTQIFFRNKELSRSQCEGEFNAHAQLDDFSYLIQALIELYQCNFLAEHLELAYELQKLQDRLFWSEDLNNYYNESGQDAYLIVRVCETSDHAIPSAQAVSLENLFRLSLFGFDQKMATRANALFTSLSYQAKSYPSAYVSFGSSLFFAVNSASLLVAVGEQSQTDLPTLQQLRKEAFAKSKNLNFLYLNQKEIEPKANFLLKANVHKEKTCQSNKLTYYLCNWDSCQTATSSLDEIREKIRRL